jgi:hypothetical protein
LCNGLLTSIIFPLERVDVISERMKPTLRKWMFSWGVIGLLIPIALILRWKLLGSTFGQIELILWPSSILLIGLEGQRSAFVIVLWYAIFIVANIVFYCVIGLLTWPLLRLALRRRGPI